MKSGNIIVLSNSNVKVSIIAAVPTFLPSRLMKVASILVSYVLGGSACIGSFW